MANERVIIGYVPDTIVTTFLGKETFVSLGYLSELRQRIPNLSFNNPLAQAEMDGETIYLAIKPLNEATENDLAAIEQAADKMGA